MRNLVLKNQVVFGTVNAGRETFEAAIRDLGVFMRRWPAAVRSWRTRRTGILPSAGLVGIHSQRPERRAAMNAPQVFAG
jgi:hypothetical protein